MKVSAYKKKDKTIRVIDIEVEHADTHEIGGVCCTKLVDDIKARQKFEDFDLLQESTFTSEGFKEALTMAIE